MRSNQLATLAGVSVRTLRHYHQVGLLPEPERSANGYRTYTAFHLATVLRIGRFTERGIPPADVARVLDDETASASLLQDLDARLHGDPPYPRAAQQRHPDEGEDSLVGRSRSIDAPGNDSPAAVRPRDATAA